MAQPVLSADSRTSRHGVFAHCAAPGPVPFLQHHNVRCRTCEARVARISSYELKFTLPPESSTLVVAWLRAHCRPDRTHPENTVSSIYYDTPDWRHLREKANGDYLKTKLRLRWYSHGAPGREDAAPESRQAYAELKQKIGSQRQKQRIEVSQDVDWLEHAPLNAAALLNLPAHLTSRGFALPAPMLPTMLIAYRRLRFLDWRTGTRINLDSEIRTRRSNPQMIQAGRPIAVATPVIEFKGSHDRLPAGFEPLLRFGARRASFSKYMMCYRSVRGALVV